MTARDPAGGPKKTVTMSLALGALLIPVAAYGASSLLSASNQPPPRDPEPVVSTTAETMPAARVTGPADLAVACGQEGMQLVAAEAAGSASDVQQAALDALRDICAKEGMPLPAPAAATGPTPVDTTPPVLLTPSAQSEADDHDHDDDHHHDDHDDEREDD